MMIFFLFCRKISIDSLSFFSSLPFFEIVCVSVFLLPAILSLLFFPSVLPTRSHCSLAAFDYLKPSLATFQIDFNIYQETTCCLDLRHESIHGWLCSCGSQFLQLSLLRLARCLVSSNVSMSCCFKVRRLTTSQFVYG